MFFSLLFLLNLVSAAEPLVVNDMMEDRIVRIGVLDSGFFLNNSIPLCDGKGVYNAIGSKGAVHGTEIVELISKNVFVKHCFVLVKALDCTNGICFDKVGKGLEYFLDKKIDILNLSYVGYEEIKMETAAIKKLIEQKVVIVNSIGNDNKAINVSNCYQYPSCADHRIISVGAINDTSNFGDRVDIYYEDSYKGKGGTSYSAARVTGLLSNIIGKVRKLKYGI